MPISDKEVPLLDIMARFSDLSNKVVVEISHHVAIRDLDNRYLTSRRIRELNAANIPGHNQFKYAYGFITDETLWTERHSFDPQTGKFIGTLARFLKEIRQYTSVASYIKELDIGENLPSLNAHQHRDFDSTQEYKHLVRETMTQSKYIYSGEIDSLMHEFEHRGEDPIVGLILALLPNLQTLDLSLIRYEPNIVMLVIGRIS